MPQITIKGVQTEYSILGNHGRDVVLLHGWGQRMIMMEPMQQHLSSHFHVINLDFPGFGLSGLPPVGWGVEDYVLFLEEFCQHLQLNNPILIGHSFGCHVAIRYALTHPVCKMVLTGAAGIRPKQSLSAQFKVKGYKFAKKAIALTGSKELEMALKNKMGSQDYRNASGVMRDTLVKVVNDDVSDILDQITMPVLLVWGENDEAAPLWMGKEMEAKMKNAGLAIFEKDDHFAYFNQNARFCRCLDIFLKEDWED